ncbi:hypothetical protein ACH5RR_020019 [Cinchona calisaya]|uniref:NAD(+) ADP-ribosyltransferase n=1 Tax=Cinchona calisaya TaxID=153742 RepID=A0ABD2ZD82_9GENT
MRLSPNTMFCKRVRIFMTHKCWDNNNKFYIIQVLESDDGGRFMVFNRWGRVGSKGQNKLSGPYTSNHHAIIEFEAKFYGKTKNHRGDRLEFVAHPKSYAWLEMDYSKTDQASTVQEPSVSKMDRQPRETRLEARLAKFISLICSISMMKQQMIEIGYNAEKLPLGKLSKSTILKGYDVLKRIADVIGQSDRKTLEQLSGEFYMVILMILVIERCLSFLPSAAFSPMLEFYTPPP